MARKLRVAWLKKEKCAGRRVLNTALEALASAVQ
jgi:hypothetical protein